MKINDQIIASITQALRRKSMNKATLAEKMGNGRSWSTKLLNGTLKRLSDDQADLLEEILDVQFFNLKEEDSLPPMVRILGERVKKDPALADFITSLVQYSEGALYHEIPFLPTKDLVNFGKEITRAAHEDPDKPGKVGKIAINFLSDTLKKIKASGDPNETKKGFTASDVKRAIEAGKVAVEREEFG